MPNPSPSLKKSRTVKGTVQKTIYVPLKTAKQIDEIAVKRRVSFSSVAVGILSDHFDPELDHLQRMAVIKRLDRLERRLLFLEHAQQVGIEALNLFISTWLTNTNPVPSSQLASAQRRGQVRYEVFFKALLESLEDRERTLLAGILAEPFSDDS